MEMQTLYFLRNGCITWIFPHVRVSQMGMFLKRMIKSLTEKVISGKHGAAREVSWI